MSAARRPFLVDGGVVLAGLLIAWLAYFGPLLAGGDAVPGDLGDARFNIYVLEHVFRWLSGEELSLLSPAMFWPYPYVLAFSDTHAGTAWVYALLRSGGLDPYQSFSTWVVLGYFASYAAGYHVARKLGLSPIVGAAFAFAFAFSLPAILRIGHAQLSWRVGVPYCFWFALRYAERGLPRDLFAFLIAFSIQGLISVYLGVFALVLCTLLILGTFVAQDGFAPRAWWRRLRTMASALVHMGAPGWRWAGAAAIALLALAAVLGFHAYVARLYGFSRIWSEIVQVVPRLQSYLMMDGLPYWAPVSNLLPDVPVRHEHQIFLGLPLLLLAITGLVSVLVGWRAADPRLRAFAACIIAALVIYTSAWSYSAYLALAYLPGINSVRAVARYMLVLAFPVAMFAGLFVRDLAARRATPWLARGAALLVAGWLTLDLALLPHHVFSSADSRERIAALTATAPATGQPLAFVVDPKDAWYMQQIDAMLAGQAMGVPTINGYSGNAPPGMPWFSMLCQDTLDMLATYDKWARQHGFRPVDTLPPPLGIGMGPCDLSVATAGGLSLTHGPPLMARDAPLVRLSDLRLSGDASWIATVRITNGTDSMIHAKSKHPLRLSWRSDPAAGWESRVGIGPDLGPGQSRDVSFFVPEGTRLGDLSVTLVSEMAFWAHDVGAPPLLGGE